MSKSKSNGWRAKKKISYKPRAGPIDCSLKNCNMTANQVNQTIAPVPVDCLVRHRYIVGNVVLVCLRAAGLPRSAGRFLYATNIIPGVVANLFAGLDFDMCARDIMLT